ncbi:hypothetical protein [Emticicia aquatilis]|uniref:hypothetical protein n=1 Tax=Emticicia aquatilis TaxID=1537369 RepID=UPI0016655955|nr:hypothetical protein [Emticicia aquatilis]
MKRSTLILTFFLIGFLILGSFLSPTPNYTIEKYGFFSGLLHGFCSFFSLILSFINSNIAVMAKNHTTSYYVGFWLMAVVSWSMIISILSVMLKMLFS